ncbi:hypothetical protein BDW60DRAFT_212836 [Aspergillus nidulans var. acristatus]
MGSAWHVPGVARAWCSSGYGITGPPHDLLQHPVGGLLVLRCNGFVLALHWLFLDAVLAIYMLCLFAGAALALPFCSLCFWRPPLCWASRSCIPAQLWHGAAGSSVLAVS